MRISTTFIILFTLFSGVAFGQLYDTCADALQIDDPSGYCSDIGAFSLDRNSVTSGFPSGRLCTWDENSDVDQWFTFVSSAEFLSVKVIGNSQFVKGGTVKKPTFMIFSGDDCSALTFEACSSDLQGFNEVQRTIESTIGKRYYVRVTSVDNRGTYQLCVTNFDLPPNLNADCETAQVLCNTDRIVVPFINGSGEAKNELVNTCLSNGEQGGDLSTLWFKFIAEDDGVLEMDLIPLKPDDDLDFAFFELPGGIGDCGNKKLLRCMASGANTNEPFQQWKPCSGRTGMRTGDPDDVEDPGCQAGNNNYVSALPVVKGRTYAFVIMNFSQSGQGFEINWGGTARFLGPAVDWVIGDGSDAYCQGDSITVFATSTSDQLPIKDWDWTFGTDGQAVKVDPNLESYKVLFPSGGDKTIKLKMVSSNGCIDGIDTSIYVEKKIDINETIVPISCHNSDDASISVTFSSESTVVSATWQDDEKAPQNRTNLQPGIYEIEVQNLNGCVAKETYELEQPRPITFESVVTKASCGSQPDGQIEIIPEGNFPPFLVDWDDGNGFVTSKIRSDIPAGVYPVKVQDDQGCIRDTFAIINEFDFQFTSDVTDPSCFGLSDGQVVITPSNTSEQVTYDWLNNGTFASENRYNQYGSGRYFITVQDVNGCRYFHFEDLVDPDSLKIDFEAKDVSCFGGADGTILSDVSGGVAGYKYTWSTGATVSQVSNLSAGSYTLQVEDINGCIKEKMVELTSPEELVVSTLNVKNVPCFGESSGAVSIDIQGGSPDYSARLRNFTPFLANKINFDQLKAGDYILEVKDNNGCIDTIPVQITQPERFDVFIGKTPIVSLGDSLRLGVTYIPPTSTVTYQWLQGANVRCEDCPDPIVKPLKTSYYIVEGTDQNGCLALDSLLLRVAVNRKVGIPNAVTVNDDGTNDVFTLSVSKSVASINRVAVFDRWGGILYNKYDVPISGDRVFTWNGIVNGRKLIPGMYVYLVDVTFLDGVVKKYSGEVHVMH